MERITEKMLQLRIDRLNELTGQPMTPYTKTENGLKANIGNYHLSHAYGGVCVHQMHNDGGGVSCPLNHYHAPKREVFESLGAFIAGIELAA